MAVQIVSMYPADGDTVTDRTITIQYVFIRGNSSSGIYPIADIKIDNISLPKETYEIVGGSGSFTVSCQVSLDNGRHTIEYYGEYNNESDTRTCVFTVEAPTLLSIIKPTDGITVMGADNELEIQGYTSEECTVNFIMNGVSVGGITTVAQNRFVKYANLSEGTNTLSITAMNTAGQSETLIRRILYSPLKITIESPVPGSTIKSNTVDFVFTVTGEKEDIVPNLIGIMPSQYSYPHDRLSNEEIVDGYRFTYTANQNDGAYTATIYTNVNDSNAFKLKFDYSIDTSLQHTKITIESPTLGSTIDVPKVYFVFTVTGEKQYIDPTQVAISPYGGYGENNLDYTELDNGYRFHYEQEYENGDYTAIIHANDYDGSNITAEIPFAVDINTTEITIESPLQDSHPAGKTVEIVFTATDSTSAISPGTGYVSIDSGRPVSNLRREAITGGYRFTYTAELEYREHTIVAGATNSAGKEKSATVTFENYAGPVATIEYPAEGQVIPHGELITPVFTVTDQHVSVDPSSAYIYFSGAGRPFLIADLDVERWGDGYRFTLQDGVVPDEGNYTFEVSCANYKGETATAQVAFIVNNAPIIEMVSPTEGETVKKKRVYVVFTATDFVPGIDPATALIYVNGHSPVGDLMYEEYGSTGYRFSKTIDAEKGENTIIVSIQDKLGTTRSKTASFVVDPVVPRITDIRITPNPCEAGQEFEIIAEVEYEEV